MRNLVLTLLVVLVVGLAGCARVTVTQITPGGHEVLYEYVRWGNQGIEGFSMVTPDGWTVTFDRQLSEFEVAFKLGLLSAQLGGVK